MTKEQLNKALQEIRLECTAKEQKLYKQFVKENNPYTVGQIVTDHIGSIQIERIVARFAGISKAPEAVYYGVELRKSDLKPMKNGSKRSVWQSNLIK